MLDKETKLIRTTGGKRFVHIITCPYIRDWDTEGCEPIDKVKYKKMAICPTCEKSIYLLEGAKDFNKKQKEYEKLFENVSASKVKNLFISQKAKSELVGTKLYINTKYDSWYIDFTLLDEVRLFHGNYDISARESHEDNFKKMGYHEHNCGNTFNSAISQIVRYDYKRAEKIHKSQRKKLKKQKFSDLVDESDSYAEYESIF